MNIRNSGKIPEKIKKLAAVIAVWSVTLCAGCNGSTISETSIGESVPSYTTEDTSTHEPVVESSDAEISSSSNTGVPISSSSESGSYSSSSSSSSSTTNSSTGSSTESSSASSSSEHSTVSSPPPQSSSVTPPPVSTSTTEKEDPPPVVTIPNFPVPTSPGTNVANSSKGWIDFSNASHGYVSTKYTGSVSKIKLVITCEGYSTPYNHDVDPGVVGYYPLSYGAGKYTVTLYENTSGTRYAEVVSCSFSTNTSSIQPFTYSNFYSIYDSNSACVKKAAELCAGKTGTIDKVAAVFGWVSSNVAYDYNLAATVQSGYVPNPDRTYNSKTGICFDYASLMCAMLRSQGIPTRLVVGWAKTDIYHAWNEIYTEETGWITPELMLKNAGWNIADATFYSTSTNKSSIASYISTSSNYTVRYYY